jgi:23S rRNA (uridine2552-2'-O)-methyltransferase
VLPTSLSNCRTKDSTRQFLCDYAKRSTIFIARGWITADPIAALPAPVQNSARANALVSGSGMSRKNPYAKPDHFTQKAKDAGFPARSVYKLEEIDRRVRLLRGGMRILDLGAAPGSWALYAAQKIGPSGKLLAIDLQPLRVALPPHATFVQGDALSIPVEFPLESASGERADASAPSPPTLALHAPYDVVLSDMAPNTTGNRFADQARSFDLFMRALAVASTLGKVGGSFVGKIFMSEDLPKARAELRVHFEEERLIRPEGTRSVSYELFVVGMKKKLAPVA